MTKAYSFGPVFFESFPILWSSNLQTIEEMVTEQSRRHMISYISLDGEK